MNTIPLQSANRRSGFTLVEMLVVITIIGILAALLIPAISGIVKKGKETAIAMEVDGLAQAIEQYNNTYGDYPPDFSDLSVALRHFRRIRPNIHNEDIALLTYLMTEPGSENQTSLRTINRAQALYLVLGGYSDDQKRPLTGSGGPFNVQFINPNLNPRFIRTNIVVTNNFDRTNKLFDFEVGRLGLTQPATPLLPSSQLSLPTFSPSGLVQPYVYFDSRTYLLGTNTYPLDVTNGGIRPYLQETAGVGLTFQKPDTFQVISAGIDDEYGRLTNNENPSDLKPVFYVSNTGQALMYGATGWQPYQLNGAPVNGFQEGSTNGHLDNITNFFSGRLDDQLVEL